MHQSSLNVPKKGLHLRSVSTFSVNPLSPECFSRLYIFYKLPFSKSHQSLVNVLSNSFCCFCLQMQDIVKAVGNCSYNQLVEKIISCKQSDNSELAGEGECFLFTPSLCSDLPDSPPVSSHLFSPVYLEVEKKTQSHTFLGKI